MQTPKRSSFRRTWVPMAASEGLEVQRLSRLALVERTRHPHRFRILRGGTVLGEFASRAEVEAALANGAPDLRDPTLLERFQHAPMETPRGDTPAGHDLVRTKSLPLPSSGPITPTTPTAPAPSAAAPPPLAHVPKHSSLPSAAVTQSPRGADASSRKAPPASGSPLTKRVSFARLSATTTEYDPDAALSSAPPLAAGTEDAPHPPPAPAPAPAPGGDWEQVLAWYYDGDRKEWDAHDLEARLADTPFAEGAMRQAFRLTVNARGKEVQYVAKRFNDRVEREHIVPTEDQFAGQDPDTRLKKSQILRMLKAAPPSDFEVMFADRVFDLTTQMTCREFLTWRARMRLLQDDVVMQEHCRACARAYNALGPPKKVTIVPAFLVAFPDRPDTPVYACEAFIPGTFVKFNNNAGAVVVADGATAGGRDTPHAFSHFSYLHSNRRHLIVDIQGALDTYTDPQVHSVEGEGGFGLGNLGRPGIDAFFRSHRCNGVCQSLRLDPP